MISCNLPIMKNQGIFLITILLIGMVYACGPSQEKLAQEKYNRASAYFEKGLYNDAKLVIDTILSDYSKDIEYTVRAEDMLRKIKIDEQKRNLVFLDSTLQEQEKVLAKLKKNFIISNDYGSKEVWIHKRQQPKNSYQRTYLKANLDSKGNFYISSHFSGDHYIKHNQIKVYNNGQSVLSEKIPEDGFNNRRFEDGGFYWEVVKYKDGKDNGIVDFISQNVAQPLKAVFIGKEHSYIVLEKYDKEAIRDAYEISFVLKEITQIKQQIDNVNQQLSKLQ